MEVGEVTCLLREVRSGSLAARNELFSLLYPKLKELASIRARHKGSPSRVQPTVLLHDAYLKVTSGFTISAMNRAAFLSLMSHTMHSVLVDTLRKPQPSSNQPEILESLPKSEATLPDSLNEALTRLGELDQRKHDIVVLHFIGGMKFNQIAAHLSVSVSTVQKDWYFSRAWLRKALDEN